MLTILKSFQFDIDSFEQQPSLKTFCHKDKLFVKSFKIIRDF